jgi:flagellar protein FlgJ
MLAPCMENLLLNKIRGFMENSIDNIYQFQQYAAKLNNLKAQAKNMEIKSANIDKTSKLYKVCQEFEAIFIKQMLNVMRKTELFHGGFEEEIFEDMLYDDYAKKMAVTGHFGLSDMLYKQLANQKQVNNA